MTSEDEKTVHQQSITEEEDGPLSVDEALEHADNTAKALGEHKAECGPSLAWELFDEEAIVVLANEVRRLREQWESTARQREKADEAFATMSADYERLRAKLTRVEALLLPDNLHKCGGGDGRDHDCIWPEDLESALKD
jgi:hypothetical protein